MSRDRALDRSPCPSSLVILALLLFANNSPVCYSRLLFKQRPLVVDEGIKCVK